MRLEQRTRTKNSDSEIRKGSKSLEKEEECYTRTQRLADGKATREEEVRAGGISKSSRKQQNQEKKL